MVFKHLHSTATCFDSYNSLCFKIFDKADSKFDLKIKEAFYINWRKLKCTTQSFSSFSYYNICLPLFFSLCLCFFFVVVSFAFLFFAFLIHLLFSFSSTLIIGIFQCLISTSLLLHLITSHLVSDLSLSSIVLIISTLIISIFYFS